MDLSSWMKNDKVDIGAKLKKYGWNVGCRSKEKIVFDKHTSTEEYTYLVYDKTLKNKIYICADIKDVEELQAICDILRGGVENECNNL